MKEIEFNIILSKPTIFDFSLILLSIIIGFSLLILLLLLRFSPFPIWVTRKTIHFLGGTFIAFMAPLFESFISIIIAIAIFLTIFSVLVISSNFDVLRNYFVLKDCRDNEKNYTFILNTTLTLLCLVFIFLFFSNYPGIFTASALVVAWSDTFGEIVGKNFPFIEYRIFNKKTLSGSLAVFFLSFISFFITLSIRFFFPYYPINFLWKIIIGSVICTLLEAISWKWLDNILLPISASCIMLWVYT